jgi:hypothetical protein
MDRKLFVYTEDANIPSAHLKELKKEGYLLVRVKSSLEYHIIREHVPEIPASTMLKSALHALSLDTSQANNNAKRFVDFLYEACKEK